MKKFLWMTALIAALALAFTACPSPTGKNDSGPIDYTVTAAPGEPTPKLIFNFKSDVSGLKDTDITVAPIDPTQLTTGALTGSGKVWELAINVALGGKITVKINKPGIVSTLKSGIAVKSAATDPTKMADYTKKKEITFGAKYDFGAAADPAWDFTDLTELDGIKTGSKLRLFFSASTAKPNTGIGSIGFLTEADGATDNRYDLDVPAAQDQKDFFIDIWAFYATSTLQGENKLSIITWKDQGVTLTKIELWEPDGTVENPALPTAPAKPQSVNMPNYDKVQEISVVCGVFNIALGKGNITGTNFTAIKDASTNARLRVYVNNNSGSDRNTWGIGKIGDADIKGKTGASFFWDLDVSDINVANDATFISTNVWGQCAITMIELWEPKAGFNPYQHHIIDGKVEIPFTSPQVQKDYKYRATLTVTRMEDGLAGKSLYAQCGLDPWVEAGGWGNFNNGSSNTIVAVPAGGSVVYIYNFTSSADYGSANKQFIQLILKDGDTIVTTGDYGIDCTVVVEQTGAPSVVEPAAVLNILSATDGLASFASVVSGKGTYNSGTKKISIAATEDNDSAAFVLGLTFSPSVNLALTEYTHLVVTWEGVSDDFMQFGSFMPKFNNVMAQMTGVKTKTITYELGTDLKNWGGSDNWADAATCTTMEITVNSINVTDWTTTLAVADAQEMVYTSIKFIKQAELSLLRELNTTTDWDYRDNDTNKGKISVSTATEIKALTAGSVLRVYISGPVDVDNGPVKPGWGVGKLGEMDIKVPGNATTANPYTCSLDIQTSAIETGSDTYGSGFIDVNIWSDFTITKIEIWTM